jgi:tetratricopeptide (TPR) repeat protein
MRHNGAQTIMAILRKTAILTFSLPSTLPQESLPLTREREYGVFLRLEGREYSAQVFRPPCNDEEWREFVRRLRDCNTNRSPEGYRGAIFIRSLARTLFQNLAALHPKLLEFLRQAGTPRRLVIQSRRPEIHLLPWGALYDTEGKLLAAGDLSIVQAWEDFSEVAEPTAGRLNLVAQLGSDTQRSTAQSLVGLPDIIERDAPGEPDILHVEAHGEAVTNEIGGIGPREMARKFARSKLALLWSCYSAAINSWGESPALCLHCEGSTMVLSFLAELNNLDATSISTFFYRDVFGAAASRDPESALVRIRSRNFANEFEYANWASMTVYLRSPIDMSALALNGPRVPSSSWTQETPEGPLAAALVETVGQLHPGSCTAMEMPAATPAKLPQAIFAGWKGTVVHLDGVAEVFSDETLAELDLPPKEAPTVHPADRLIWLTQKLSRYGSPLIVWTHASPAHLEFLRIIAPDSPLTFLLLTTQGQPPSVAELVDHNLLAEARAACSPEISGDESFSAAYFAFVRGEKEEKPCCYLNKLQSPSERLLLSGNFVSRFRKKPGDQAATYSDLQLRKLEETYYRDALSQAITEKNFRDAGRARLELGYLLQSRAETVAAESMYRSALDDLQRPTAERDTRWHSALGRVLRDWADLLAVCPDRLDEASRLLQRALAIHAFHGRVLQIAYARTTAARIAFTAGRYSEAVQSALNAANAFEAGGGWRGWGEPMEILLNTLAETRDTPRMKAVTQLAIQKVVNRSNLPQDRRERLIALFRLKQIQSLWMAGEFDEARSDLKSLPEMGDARLQSEADRIRKFLTI